MIEGCFRVKTVSAHATNGARSGSFSPRCLATYRQAQPVALLRDLCAGSACRLFPFHYNIEYQREFATQLENPGTSNGEWKCLGFLQLAW